MLANLALPNIVLFSTLSPEALILASATIFLMGGVFANDKRSDRLFLWLGLLVLATALAMLCVLPISLKKQLMLSNMLVSDAFSMVIKFLLVAGTALALAISDSWLVKEENQRFEYMVLMMFSLLGMLLMVSANDLLAFYIALELSSLPLYVLASFSRDSVKSTEAGLKYFVLSALASGLLLFGISLVYGFAGSTNFDALALLFKGSHDISKAVVFGMILVMTGLCFKISAAPFHMWTPDVYEGAPTPITSFFSVAPKLAALGLFARVLVQPFGALTHDWQQIVVFVSILSMLVGAFGALWQTNIKRLLAYSSIGHVGYTLVGLAAGTQDGVASMIVYFALYIPMSIGAFAIILMMQKNGKYKEEISDLAGLSRENPWMALGLALFMFSMAGIPPLAGFFAKLYVFQAAINAGLYTLAVIGVLSSVVACFYYIKIVKVMYFDETSEGFDKSPSATLNMVMYVCAAVTVFFFVIPTPLISLARVAAGALFR